MRTLVVFFSFEGNTKLVGEAIAKTMDADIVELKTSKQYPTEGFGKFFWGGKSVLFGETPELINEKIDVSKYDTVIIGTPIWAGSFAPPIKSFISQYQMKGKRIALFACHGGGGAKKCFSKLKEAFPENKFIGEIAFVEPKKNTEESSNEAVKWASELQRI
ncbi:MULTISPECIES: flavodoxin family protein [Anaerotignum]|uniref:flavodoxin family protein n=1 Tax=Anaerotignum TaxID=2039240 RepID=UPI002109A74C|nr:MULTISPECIES: flavodoxin [Anaerotignum]MCQ4937179.1 NAD(P)H-dependent oxidoreductase [Anaerotignum propionicum]